ncbi:MAG: hypothetical protein ACPGJV_02335 [Bacteriovoracaceae bacterium]
MKSILFTLGLFLFVSCSSAEKQEVQSRDVASFSPLCTIEKHPSQEVYRFKMFGKSYSEFWYTVDEVRSLYDQFVMQGRCL